MKTQLMTQGLGFLTIAVLAVTQTGSALAGPIAPLHTSPPSHNHPQTRLRPVFPPAVTNPGPFVPRLGILGHIHYGRGMVVDSVNYGSLASRMGLERGDVIVRINNQPINTDQNYNQALVRAQRFQDGFVDVVVVDVRSGRTRHRSGNLNGPATGPSLPRFTPPVHTPHAPMGHAY